jgi:hypothetical protein
MSNKLAKAERSKAKDARQIPAPDARPRRSNPRNKKERVWAVEMQGREFKRVEGGWIMTSEPDRIYLPWGKYRTKEIAQEVVDLQNRKYGGNDFRIRPDEFKAKTQHEQITTQTPPPTTEA